MKQIVENPTRAGDNHTSYDSGLTLHARFAAAGSLVMLIGMFVLSWLTGREIEDSVTRNSAISTALFMESFIAPLSQELGPDESLSPETQSGVQHATFVRPHPVRENLE